MDNVLFFHGNEIRPTKGGVSRITYNLIFALRKYGISTYALGQRKIGSEKAADFQYFLPSFNLSDPTNVTYVKELLEKLHVRVIINQFAIMEGSVRFLNEVRRQVSDVKIISCLHNSVLTQFYNYPFQIEHKLKENHLGLVFSILSLKVCRKMFRLYGIHCKRRQYNDLVSMSDKVIMLSPGHKEELMNVVSIPFGDKISYIPNCVEARETMHSNKENIILWIGTVDTTVKRIDFMLDVWRQFSKGQNNWNLFILGDGPALRWAKEKSKADKMTNIYFEGRVHPESYYERAKLSCVTSSHESFSMVILESLQYGVVPVVNNSYPSASYLIENGENGYLCEMFNRREYCHILNEVTSDESLLYRMSEKARESVKSFYTDKICKEWIKVFQSL